MAVEECVIVALPRRLFMTILADYPQAAATSRRHHPQRE
jgi:hypothetical protein